VAVNCPTKWWISNDKFSSILDRLAGRNFTYLDNYDPLANDHVVITFDGPYACILEFAAPELHRRGIPFEVYLIGDYIGGDNSFDSSEPLADFCTLEQLKELKTFGGRFQWHTRTHQISDSPSSEEIRFELEIPNELLDLFPGDFKHFAYPYGKVTSDFKEKVSEKFVSAQSVDNGISGEAFDMPRVTVFPETDFKSSTLTLLLMNYNYAPYILEAHDSVKRQTLRPDLYRIVDDASTDGSQELINRIIDGAEVICRKENMGIVDNFNSAMNDIATDYAMFLGADNYLHPEALRELKLSLDSNPDVAIVYFDMILVGPLAAKLANSVSAKKIGRSIRDNCDLFLWTFPDFDDEQKSMMEKTNIINGSAMFRVSAFREVGGYQKIYPEDHNLWKRMIAKGFVAKRVGKPLLYYRQHSPSQANTALSKELELVDLRRKVTDLQNLIHGSNKELDVLTLGQIILSIMQNVGIVFGNPKLLLRLILKYLMIRSPSKLRNATYRLLRWLKSLLRS
jgi:glycosyltransferase involved in cell wall biosynthesis